MAVQLFVSETPKTWSEAPKTDLLAMQLVWSSSVTKQDSFSLKAVESKLLTFKGGLSHPYVLDMSIYVFKRPLN